MTPISPELDEFPSVWAHAVNSVEKLVAAMSDQAITSIECDVMMSEQTVPNLEDGVPILSHPPFRQSDLTFEKLLDTVTEQSEDGTRNLITKHLKLDFKEIQALQPSLKLLQKMQIYNPYQKVVILNADILPGPGKRTLDPTTMVPADEFVTSCLDYIDMETSDPDKAAKFAFSLGYRCDYTNTDGYLASDAVAMKDIVEQYQLDSKQHVTITLALNARLLARNVSAFDSFLEDYATSNILAWTGSGEPPIPLEDMHTIKTYYVTKGMVDRIEFDCCIEK
ncbi:DUF2181 domain containing protein [Nitzschia inconspicua]|uniref:DUF2181 domain containing protein n=1 Tax=Nitzschia inconspicua TaxID=303405 RepID=A0A9K3KV06_9STRA|nr:DUF2181 domain containing protein [Nitzschia inconspicua]